MDSSRVTITYDSFRRKLKTFRMGHHILPSHLSQQMWLFFSQKWQTDSFSSNSKKTRFCLHSKPQQQQLLFQYVRNQEPGMSFRTQNHRNQQLSSKKFLALDHFSQRWNPLQNFFALFYLMVRFSIIPSSMKVYFQRRSMFKMPMSSYSRNSIASGIHSVYTWLHANRLSICQPSTKEINI